MALREVEAPELIHLLGVVRSGDGPTERVLSGVQPRTVLVLTAIRHGRPVTADGLAEVLRPEDQDATERSTRGVVSKVRAFLDALGPSGPRLDNVGHGYCFTCPDMSCVDVQRAQDELEEAERLLLGGSPQEAAAPAQRAVRLLDAPLLPDLDGDWLDHHRADLAQQLLRAMRLATAAESARVSTMTRCVALAAVDRDPLDEVGHRALMDAYLAPGNSATAHSGAYGTCGTILAEELGVTPSEETERLYMLLLDAGAEPATAGPGPQSDGATVRRTAEHPFVGRTGELARLSDAWATARTGRRQIVLVRGDAGAGKTRLSLEAVRRTGPTHFLYGRASPEQVIAFEPFSEALGRHLTQLDDEQLATVVGSDGPVLASLIPVVATRCRVDPTHRVGGDERLVALEAVRSVLRRIASEPTVLVIDDLHWADASTLLLLRHLLRVLDSARLMVVATYRDDEEPDAALSDALIHLHQMDGCHPLRLDGLSPAEVTQLLSGTGIADAPEVGPILSERTGGNPFYLVQVLSAATEQPDVFDPLKVPDTVSELVRHRVGSLPNDAREVLALAATIGTTVGRDLLDRGHARRRVRARSRRGAGRPAPAAGGRPRRLHVRPRPGQGRDLRPTDPHTTASPAPHRGPCLGCARGHIGGPRSELVAPPPPGRRSGPRGGGGGCDPARRRPFAGRPGLRTSDRAVHQRRHGAGPFRPGRPQGGDDPAGPGRSAASHR